MNQTDATKALDALWMRLNDCGLGRGTTLQSVQRWYRVTEADAQRLFDLREAAMAAVVAAEAERDTAVEANLRDRAQMDTALREARSAAYAAGQADRDAQVREARIDAFKIGWHRRSYYEWAAASNGARDEDLAAYLATHQPAAGAPCKTCDGLDNPPWIVCPACRKPAAGARTEE